MSQQTETQLEDEAPPRPDLTGMEIEPPAQLPATTEAARPTPQQASEIPELQEHELQGMITPALLHHMQRIATLMAHSSLIPESLWCRAEGTGQSRKLVPLPAKTVLANCFLIVNQARLWRIDPWALAQATSVVHGRLMFEGKAITAVLESTRGIRLKFEWNNEQGDAFGITVTERRPVEEGDELRSISGTVGAWKTKGKNGAASQAWLPPANRMQLAYRGAREWCRLHEPAVVLGVLMDDDADRMIERRELEAAPAAEAPVIKPGFATPSKPTRKKRGPKFDMNTPEALVGAEPATEASEGATEAAPGATAETREESTAPESTAKPVEKIDTAAATDTVLPGPVERYHESHLPAALSWEDIKLALRTISEDPWWSTVDAKAHQACERAAWARMREILRDQRGRATVSLIEDLTAFRCYMRFQTSSQAVEETWRGVKGGEAYKHLKTQSRLALATMVEDHLRELRFKEDGDG